METENFVESSVSAVSAPGGAAVYLQNFHGVLEQ
jgi:hypothetical protein|tara:strand:- start:381 stop:482 length:102 start_codon:yes stop_codon:yes gene_type:complete